MIGRRAASSKPSTQRPHTVTAAGMRGVEEQRATVPAVNAAANRECCALLLLLHHPSCLLLGGVLRSDGQPHGHRRAIDKRLIDVACACMGGRSVFVYASKGMQER